MDESGHIDRKVAIALDQDALALARNRRRLVALAREHCEGHLVELNGVKRRVGILAAAGVGVQLRHELLDGADAVAGHVERVAPRRRRHPAVDDQHAMLRAEDATLDENVRPLPCFPGGGVSLGNVLALRQADEHGAAMIRALRLDDHQATDLTGSLPGIVGVSYDPSLRRGNANGGQQFLGKRLLPADFLANG